MLIGIEVPGGPYLSYARYQATLVSRSTRASDRTFFFSSTGLVFLLCLRLKIHTKLARRDAGEDYQTRLPPRPRQGSRL